MKTTTSGLVGFLLPIEFVRLSNLFRLAAVSFDAVLRAEGGLYSPPAVPADGPDALPDLTALPKAMMAGGLTACLVSAPLSLSALFSCPAAAGALGMPPPGPLVVAVPGLPVLTFDSIFWNFFITNRSAKLKKRRHRQNGNLKMAPRVELDLAEVHSTYFWC